MEGKLDYEETIRETDRHILTNGFRVPSPKVPSRTQKKVTVAVKVFATTYERTPNLHLARNSEEING